MADYTGSFSGSFEGNGRLLTSIDYYSLENLPRTITSFEENSILANNAVRDNFTTNVKTRLSAESVISSSAQLPIGVISGSSQIASLGYLTSDSDSQTLSIAGSVLTISGGNNVTLPAGGGGASIWATDNPDRIPTEAELALGELAINTYDGKLFFLKDNGIVSLESIVTTGAQITGSVNLYGSMTASAFLITDNTSSNDLLLVRVSGNDKVKVNSDGTFIINSSESLPTGATGGLSVSGSNFFVYL